MKGLDNLKSKRKKIAPVILLIIVISCALYYSFGRDISYIGQVEAVIVTNPAETSGKIVGSYIALGQEVKERDVIAVIDSSGLEYALEQLMLSLEKAMITSADAETGQSSRAQSSIAAAQAAVSGASAAANKANQDYQKSLALYQSNAISESALQSAKLQADTAASALAAAAAQLELARNNSVGSISESSNIDILILESKIAQQKDMIEKCTIRANADGIIISKNYGLGDFVAPGYNIADIASANEKYIVTYLPKEKVSEISYNAEVSFVYNDVEYSGAIKFIDVKPQYTPQDFQTSANKNKESVKVKILIPEGNPIKPGETVTLKL